MRSSAGADPQVPPCRCRFKVFKGAVKGKVNNTGSAMQKRMKERQW